VLTARGYQAELWAELALHAPSQARLDSIGACLRHAMTEADHTFKHLLRLNPNGVAIMRRYATFLVEVGAAQRRWRAHDTGRCCCCGVTMLAPCFPIGLTLFWTPRLQTTPPPGSASAKRRTTLSRQWPRSSPAARRRWVSAVDLLYAHTQHTHVTHTCDTLTHVTSLGLTSLSPMFHRQGSPVSHPCFIVGGSPASHPCFIVGGSPTLVYLLGYTGSD
jgi:hypothetical protein